MNFGGAPTFDPNQQQAAAAAAAQQQAMLMQQQQMQQMQQQQMQQQQAASLAAMNAATGAFVASHGASDRELAQAHAHAQREAQRQAAHAQKEAERAHAQAMRDQAAHERELARQRAALEKEQARAQLDAARAAASATAHMQAQINASNAAMIAQQNAVAQQNAAAQQQHAALQQQALMQQQAAMQQAAAMAQMNSMNSMNSMPMQMGMAQPVSTMNTVIQANNAAAMQQFGMGMPMAAPMPQMGMPMAAPMPQMGMPVVMAQAPLATKDVDLVSHDAFVTFTFGAARDLIKPSGKLPYPYIKLFMDDKEVFKSAHAKETVNPAFNVQFKANQLSEHGDYKIEIWNKGWITDDFMGFFAIMKRDIQIDAAATTDFQLFPRPNKHETVTGHLMVQISAVRKTIVESINETLASLNKFNFLYLNLAPGVQPLTLLNLAQTIGLQQHYRVSSTGQTVALSKFETFTRHETTTVYQNGQHVQVQTPITYQEEILIQVAVLATSSGLQYAQVSYTNPKHHHSFFEDWKAFCTSMVQSALSGGVLNSDVRLKTVVGSSDAANSGGCTIQ
jgi:hypothetical protein